MCRFISAMITKDYRVFIRMETSDCSYDDIIEKHGLIDDGIGSERDCLLVEYVPNGGNPLKWKYVLDLEDNDLEVDERLPSWYDAERAETAVERAVDRFLRKLGITDKASLAGINLAKACCGRLSFVEINFAGANLKETNLWGNNYNYANFQGADLRGACLIKAKLMGANLQGADLTGADLTQANLEAANLKGAKIDIRGIKWANLERANLEEADLQGANIRGTGI